MKAVTIERLAFGGSGFGRLDGKACFVPFTAPGDVVEITPAVEKKSYITAKLERIISPSPVRIPPPCPVFGRCGGCHWQHLPYEAQLEAKREIFADTLQRTGGVPWEAVLPPLAAPEPFGYRSRIQLKVHGRSEKLHIGFFAQGSHYVVDIRDACPLASPAVNAVLPATRRFLSVSPDKGNVPQVDIATGEGGGTVMIFHYIGKNVKAFADALSRFDFPADYHLAVQSGRKSSLVPVRGDGRLSYGTGTDRPLSLTFGPGAFSQVNYRQNRALVAEALAMAELTGKERVLDLYCGNGNFSLAAAARSSIVTGLEEFAPSIDDARRNALENGVENVSFDAVDAVRGMRRLVDSRTAVDLVILDPPRAGAADCVKLLPGLGAERIVYVSCDPPTLARDLSILAAGGYSVVKSRPVDMFPQTYHIESVTLLEINRHDRRSRQWG